MENKNQSTELTILSSDRESEQIDLNSKIKNKIINDESLNNSNNSNNSGNNISYVKLINESNSLNLNVNIDNNNANNVILYNEYGNKTKNKYKPINQSKINRKTQLCIFVPIVSIKILIPVFFMQKYIIYSFENEEDQNYCKFSVWILTSLIFFCYFLATFTPSTQSNVNKYFDDTKNNIFSVHSENPGNDLQDLNLYQWTDCIFCNSKKFIRSSHCRTCNRCILMRDHHCPYIGNCVGFRNIQYFFNFLFWGDLGMLFYAISCIKYYFFSNIKNVIIIPFYLKIVQYIDFVFTFFFIINLFGLIIRLFLNIYNNRTQLENIRGPIIEYFCPICPKCKKDFSRFNIIPEVNTYNIGFLSNLYYIIGPTPFHFIFPLPKNNNYILNENSPIFKKLKNAERLDIFKFMVKKDQNKINILNDDDSSPEVYIQNCHKYYDGKRIK